MADSIIGLPAVQSRVLIAYLLHEMERPEHVYEHVWQPGDLVAYRDAARLARSDSNTAGSRSSADQSISTP